MKREKVYAKVLIGLFACLIILGLVFVGQIGYAIYQDHQITEVRVAHKAGETRGDTNPPTLSRISYAKDQNNGYIVYAYAYDVTDREGVVSNVIWNLYRAGGEEVLTNVPSTYHDGNTWGTGFNTQELQLAEGEYAAAAYLIDNSSNSVWSQEIIGWSQFIVDHTAPTQGYFLDDNVRYTNVSDGETFRVTAQEAGDNLSGVDAIYLWVSTEPGKWNIVDQARMNEWDNNGTRAWYYDVTVRGEGTYTCHINTVDREGNWTGNGPYETVVVTRANMQISSVTYDKKFTNGSTIYAYANGVKGGVSPVTNVVWSLYKAGGEEVLKEVASTYQNGETWGTEFNIANLPDGEYAAGARLIDSLGSEKWSQELIGWSSFYIDRTAPSQSYFLDDNRRYTNASDTETVRVSVQEVGDNLSGVEGVYLWVSTEANKWNIVDQAKMSEWEHEGSGVWYYDVPVSEEGEYVCQIATLDRAGNWAVNGPYEYINIVKSKLELLRITYSEPVDDGKKIYAYAENVNGTIAPIIEVMWNLYNADGTLIYSEVPSTYSGEDFWGTEFDISRLESGVYAATARLTDVLGNAKSSQDIVGWSYFTIGNGDPNAISLTSISYSTSVVKGPTIDAYANGVRGPVKNVVWSLLKAGGEIVLSDVASTYSGERTWGTTFNLSSLENGEYTAVAYLMGDNDSKASYDLIGWSTFTIDRVGIEHGRFLDDEVRFTNAADGTTFRVTAVGPTADAAGIAGMFLWVTTDHQDGYANSWNQLEGVQMIPYDNEGTVQFYYDVPITGEGTYLCHINPVDNLGNWKWGGPVEYMVVARTAPILSSISYNENVTSNTLIYAYANGVKGTIAPVSSVTWNLYKADGKEIYTERESTNHDGETWSVGFDISTLEDGVYTATARLTDTLGNAKWSHDMIGWSYFTIDKQNSLRPTGVEGSVTTKQNTPVTGKITMTSNDKIARVDVVAAPTHGTVTCKSDLTFEYTPERGFYGRDEFKVAVVNENGISSNPIKISVKIRKVLSEDDIVKAVDTTIRIKMNESYTTRAFPSVDLNYDPLTYTISKNPADGTASIVDKTKIKYEPKRNSIKSDRFKVTVSNGTESVEITFNVYIDENEVKINHTWYIRGYEDGTVRPDGTITREELATILYRIDTNSQETTVRTSIKYTDVDSSRWSYNAIMYLSNLSVLTGYEDGSFRPANPITRAELSAIIARYAKLTSKTNISYSDLSSTHWANDVIAKATQKGYMTGYTTGEFKPDQKLTRAEATTVINRLLERNVEGITLTTSPFKDLSPAHWAFKQIMEATASHICSMDENHKETWLEHSYPYLTK